MSFNKKEIAKILVAENKHVLDLLLTFSIPDSIEDSYDEYLLQNKQSKSKTSAVQSTNAEDIDELTERLKIIKNKMKSKKRPMSERSVKKLEAKKLKKNKEFKKVILTVAKSMKNEKHKIEEREFQDISNNNKECTKLTSLKPVYNDDGNMVFSKFDFAAKTKRSHQNPKLILKKIKEMDTTISEMKLKGEVEKASELKNEAVWKKVFDKIEGKKVKDDPKLLLKSIKKRKVEKKKSKNEWMDRKKKVDLDIENRQKKRQENINKRIKDKKTNKLKRLSKKGKVIPGF